MAHAASVTTDIDADYALLKEKGIEFLSPPVGWVTPFDDEQPYPLPVTHFGIQRLVIQSEAGDNMMATKVATLQSQGIKMVSAGAPCCSGMQPDL